MEDKKGVKRGKCLQCSECDGFEPSEKDHDCNYCHCPAVKHERLSEQPKSNSEQTGASCEQTANIQGMRDIRGSAVGSQQFSGIEGGVTFSYVESPQNTTTSSGKTYNMPHNTGTVTGDNHAKGDVNFSNKH